MKRHMTRMLVLVMVFTLVSTLAVAHADFFDDIGNVEEIYTMREKANYLDMRDFVNGYIEENQPEETDSVYQLQTLLDGISEALDSTEEIVDDFDGSRSLSFDGVTSFDDGYCIVPGYNESRSFYADIGFISDDFIFFDNIAISIDGNVVMDVDVDEAVTDVLDDGKVTEYVKWSVDFMDTAEIEAMRESENTVIRFLNTETEEKFQHTLAEEEKSALYHAWQCFMMRSEIYSIYDAYLNSEGYAQLLQNTEPFDCGNGYPMCPSGTRSRYNLTAKTELDEEIFTGTDAQREALAGTVYIVTGALTLDSFYHVNLIVDGKTLKIDDTEYSHEEGADYTMPSVDETTNFILTYERSSGDDSATFLLGAKESFVTDLRAGR